MMHAPQRPDLIKPTLSSSVDLSPPPALSLPPSLAHSLCVTLSLSIWRPLHHPPQPHPLLVFPLNKLSRTPVYQEVFGLGQCTGCAHMVNKQRGGGKTLRRH